MQIQIDDKQVREMLVRLRKAGYAKQVALMIATRIQEKVAPYPPSSEANRAARGKTHYQRGYGNIYTRIGGGRTARKTSQMTGRKWDVVEVANGARLRNTSTYSGYLHDRDLQPRFHKKRGWKTWQDALDQMRSKGEIEKMIEEVFDDSIL